MSLFNVLAHHNAFHLTQWKNVIAVCNNKIITPEGARKYQQATLYVFILSLKPFYLLLYY